MQMRKQQATPDDEEADDLIYDGPSKSSRKREMHALQAMGAELVELSADSLKRVPLPERLHEAILDYKRFTKHEARRRQLQFIGRLMRDVEPEPIRAQLDVFNGVSRLEVARQHRLEKLRDSFLEDEQRIGDIVADWPDVDVQHLRALRRNALKERELGKPPRAYREIFRILRDLDRAASEPLDPEPGSEPQDTENS